MTRITTVRDLRNWVDAATSGWIERDDTDVDEITETIQFDKTRPAWGTDWSAYLESLPDLVELLDDQDSTDPRFGPAIAGREFANEERQ